ncbi:Hypothetical predicted protein, partial [Paramuricea clavata]
MRINSVKLLKSKQCGILPFLNRTKECDQINNDRIEVEAPVRDNMKDVCLKPNDNKPEDSNEENERVSQPMAANIQASHEVNTNLNASLQSEKSTEGEISKVYSSDQFIHNPSGPNPSEGQNVKSHRKSILPNSRSLRQNTSWINSLPLIDTSCTRTSSRTQTRSRSNRTYSSKTTSCKKPNQYQATRQQPSQNRTRGFQLHFPKHNRLKSEFLSFPNERMVSLSRICASSNEEQITSRSHLSHAEIVRDNGDPVQISDNDDNDLNFYPTEIIDYTNVTPRFLNSETSFLYIPVFPDRISPQSSLTLHKISTSNKTKNRTNISVHITDRSRTFKQHKKRKNCYFPSSNLIHITTLNHAYK